jgi:cell fate regulator YaaT (PSP1 superfamily)
MCCLAYEEEGYDALRKQMPVIGTKVNVDGKRGVVVGQNILKQSVNVSFSNGNGDGNIISEVDLNRNKK